MAYSYSMQPSHTNSSNNASSSSNGMQQSLDVNRDGYYSAQDSFSAPQDQYYDYSVSSNLSYQAAYASPAGTSWPIIEDSKVGYATSQSSSADSPSASSNYGTARRSSVVDSEALAVSRERKRKMQNRNSQRAFRERAREKEETMKKRVAELQKEIERLQRKEKTQAATVEVLQKEIERLKNEWWAMASGNGM